MLWGRTWTILVCLLAWGSAEKPLDPVPVCQAAANWRDYDRRPVAMLGRYSFRGDGPQKGRWLDEETCAGTSGREKIRLILDEQNGPRPPEAVAIDEQALETRIANVKQRTSLGKFRFGSADYDRWAVVFGRFERFSEQDMRLSYRGDGAVFFLAEK